MPSPSIGCLAAFGLTLFFTGCANDAKSPPRLDSGVVPQITGCERARALSFDGGCFVQWACSEGGAHLLTCARLDGGMTCSCIQGDVEPTDEPVAASPDTCAVPYEETAATVCGWSVQ